MDNTTDIRQFKALFAQWLEAETDIAGEQELMRLAEKLSDQSLEAVLAKDVAMVMAIKKASERCKEAQGKKLFMQRLDDMIAVAPLQRRRYRWAIISVAASLLVLISAGVWLFREVEKPVSECEPICADVQEQTASVKTEKVVAAVAESPQKQEYAKTAEVKTSTVRTPARPEVIASEIPGEESDLHESRIVTDPYEAAEIVDKSYEILLLALTKVHDNTREAEVILKENIDLLNYELI